MVAKVVGLLVLLSFISSYECGKVLSGFMGGGMDMPSWLKAFSLYTNSSQSVAHYSTSFNGGGYLGWQEQVMNQAWAFKSVPFISLDPSPMWPTPAASNVSAIVLRGDYDAFLDEYTTWLKNWLAGPDNVYGNSDDRRVYMRFAHEFNIYPWKSDPEKFILMWRYVWQKFQVKGLNYLHVQWVWCASGGSSSWDMDNPPFYVENYYPGDAYVDWLSYDSYNWGTLNSWSSWIDVPTTHSYSINRIGAISPNKPIVIAETSCGVAGGSVAMKNTWLSNFYPYISGTNKVQMIVLFNTDADGANWYLFAPNVAGNDQYTYAGGPYLGAKNFTTYSALKSISQYVYAPSTTNVRILSDAEFLGQLSGSKPCPSNCNVRGSCNLLGQCACMQGWSGSACTTAIAIPQCKGVGSICSSKGDCIDGKCYCDTGYVGEGCHVYAPNSSDFPIYENGLQPTWRDKESNSPVNYGVTSIKRGTNGTSMSIDLNNWGFVYWEKTADYFYKSNFGYLNFWVYSSSVTSFSKLWISIQGTAWTEVSQKLYVNNYIIGTIAANTWLEVRMPASAFQITSTAALTGFLVRPVQFAGVIYLDDIKIVNANAPVIPSLPALADVIYDGTIRNGWYNLNYSNASLTYSAIKRTNPYAIDLPVMSWQGIYFERSTAVDNTKYSGVTFWMRGGVANLKLRIGYSTTSWSIVNQLALASPPVGSWAQYTVTFAQLGATANNVVRGIMIQSNTAAYLGEVFIDDISLVPK